MITLVDSDILIDALNGRAEAVEMLRSRRRAGLVISIITLGEIYDGVVGSPSMGERLDRTRGFLAPYPVVPLSEAIMLRFATLRVRLRGSGRLIPDFDLLIAATALERDFLLLTRNFRHYQRIPELRLTELP
jgi:predicted nucleic acid-binding protein